MPATVQLQIGLGQPSGTDCTTTQTATAAESATPQVTTTLGPGTYCARIADIGNLFAPATFRWPACWSAPGIASESGS